MIDRELLKHMISGGDCYYWCSHEEDRIPFLEALTDLGYIWQSGDQLTALNNGAYQVDDGIFYHIHTASKNVTKGRDYRDGMILVETLYAAHKNVAETDLMELLEG